MKMTMRRSEVTKAKDFDELVRSWSSSQSPNTLLTIDVKFKTKEQAMAFAAWLDSHYAARGGKFSEADMATIQDKIKELNGDLKTTPGKYAGQA